MCRQAGSKGNGENVTTSRVWTTAQQFAREWRLELHVYWERSNYVNDRIFTRGTLMVDRCELHTKLLNRVGYLVVSAKNFTEERL